MRFSAEQEHLRAAVRGLAERRAGDPGRMWRDLAGQIGAQGLALPERYGGGGFSCRETHVVMEELGRALAPVPFLGSAILAGQALAASEDRTARRRWLPRLADGSLVAALAWADEGARDIEATTARAVPGPDGSWRLTGAKDRVLDIAAADLMLVAARGPDGPGLFAVDPGAEGVTVTARVPLDPSRPQGRVALDRAPARRVARDGAAVLERALDAGRAALAAEQVGGAAYCLEAAVAYAGQRVQFGRPIGAFQAVKHRLADMLVLVESARSAAQAASFALADGAPDAPEVVSLAASVCAEAFRTVAGEAVQLHGGIGVTWEHPCQRYFKRAHASALLLGSPEWHRRRLAGPLGLDPD
ncbi:acyl-CoA dehydrogenase family protein [Nocardiopsis mangrovi]|uniref:Acyl-CoA dehydrogenase family protein n=1 Tax=Nocardiopsis mangrovi TaxID=1179818 RepID=A0ABV9DYG4_9ACTN